MSVSQGSDQDPEARRARDQARKRASWALRDDRTLSPMANLVWWALYSRGDDAYPSNTTLEGDCGGIARATRRKACKELVAGGWLIVIARTADDGDSDTNRYEVTCPEAVSGGGTPGGGAVRDPTPRRPAETQPDKAAGQGGVGQLVTPPVGQLVTPPVGQLVTPRGAAGDPRVGQLVTPEGLNGSKKPKDEKGRPNTRGAAAPRERVRVREDHPDSRPGDQARPGTDLELASAGGEVILTGTVIGSADGLFAEFADEYPRMVNRDAARQAWADMVTAHPEVDPRQVIAAAKAYAADRRVKAGFAMYPANWLRDRRWTDDPYVAPKSPATLAVEVGLELAARMRAEEAAARQIIAVTFEAYVGNYDGNETGLALAASYIRQQLVPAEANSVATFTRWLQRLYKAAPREVETLTRLARDHGGQVPGDAAELVETALSLTNRYVLSRGEAGRADWLTRRAEAAAKAHPEMTADEAVRAALDLAAAWAADAAYLARPPGHPAAQPVNGPGPHPAAAPLCGCGSYHPEGDPCPA